MDGSEASVGRLDRGKHVEHIEVLTHVHGTRTDSHGDPSGAANLSAEEPYALMRARTGLWEPRVGNDPRRPGPESATSRAELHSVGPTDACKIAPTRGQVGLHKMLRSKPVVDGTGLGPSMRMTARV